MSLSDQTNLQSLLFGRDGCAFKRKDWPIPDPIWPEDPMDALQVLVSEI